MQLLRFGSGISAILALSACNAIVGVEDVQGTGPTGSSSSGDVGGMGGSGGCKISDDCPRPDISTCKVGFCNLDGVCEERPAGPGADCDNGTCNGSGICVRIDGAPCTNDAGCVNAHCVDGLCCEKQCDGLCQTCNSPAGNPGKCQPVPSGMADSSGTFATCVEPMVCDALSKCVLGLGTPCEKSEECFGSQCVDGVCCKSDCSDTCYACNIPGNLGNCVAVPAGFDDNGSTLCVGSTVSCDGGGSCLKEIGAECMSPTECASGMCNGSICTGNSCEGLDVTCSPSSPKSCCAANDVSGGDFSRNNNDNHRADVADFTLDKYEVTVARFRQFVNAYASPGTIPMQGDGAHPRISGSGWDATWINNLPLSQADLKNGLSCMENALATWSEIPGATDTMPINCVSWAEAFAFCIWDGGRLPTEAEWNYAAAAGLQQREYPWGSAQPTASLASYDCLGDGSPAGNCTINDIRHVGSKSTGGDGFWGHADLAGNIAEYTLDTFQANPPVPCVNCASLVGGSRTLRGGAWNGKAIDITTTARASVTGLAARSTTMGFRCARDKYSTCGNGVVDSGEVCDDNAFNPKDKVGCKRCDRVRKVVAGDTHACVVTQKGRLKCWGENNQGQLGQGTITGIEKPSAWPFIEIDNVQDVAVSMKRTCVLTKSNEVKCFGADSLLSLGFTGLLGTGVVGQQAVGDNPSEMRAIKPVMLAGAAEKIVSGRGHSCALLSDSSVRCWGSNVSGRLGIGNTSMPVGGIGGPVFAIAAQGLAASYDSTCALLAGNGVACWGDNRLPPDLTGALGINTNEPARGDEPGDMLMPVTVVLPNDPMGIPITAKSITASGHHYCIGAEVVAGAPIETYCWGLNDRGQLGHGDTFHWGDGTDGRDMTNLPPTPLGTEILQISAGRSHSCALYTNGEIKCWGSNISGELCNGVKPSSSNVGDEPNEMMNIVALKNTEAKAIQISAGDKFTCALFDNGGVKCWGDNTFGQVGAPQLESSKYLCDEVGKTFDMIPYVDPL